MLNDKQMKKILSSVIVSMTTQMPITVQTLLTVAGRETPRGEVIATHKKTRQKWRLIQTVMMAVMMLLYQTQQCKQ